MNALPKAVQKQIEEANKLAEQLFKEQASQQTPEPEKPPVPDPGTPPATAPGDTPPAADTAPPKEAPPPPPSAPEGWEQRYKVLQGKYNAEVPRLQRQLVEQSSVIEQLKQQMTGLQGMLTAFAQNRVAAPGGSEPAPAAPAKLVKDEEVKEFGEDLTDFIRRVSQETMAPLIDQRIQPVQQQVTEVRGMTEEERRRVNQDSYERLLSTLDREIDGWRQQNSDPLFLEWLDQPDPYSGVARGVLLKQATDGFDAPRIIAIFKGYRSENAVVTPPPPPAAAQPAPQRGLEDFVAPGATKPGVTVAHDGAGKRTWTQAEINRFYSDAAAGRYKTQQKRRDEIEREIHEAVREGRVR